MLETGTSGLMSGEGKPPAASRSRSSALPRLYVRPTDLRERWAVFFVIAKDPIRFRLMMVTAILETFSYVIIVAALFALRGSTGKL
jgi:hypothetical protein